MQKVITINLNGVAYQIDEGGYAALVAYLEGAQRQLADNPDRAEIVADLEQAIADKCRAFLGPHKTVVAAAEVEQIIREMGPVDGASGNTSAGNGGSASAGTSSSHTGAGTPGAARRLYLIREGAMLAGVCNGLAAYLGVDATIVRIVFALITLVTQGGFGIAYLVLAFVIPAADTSEERAAAHGQPFNAQELIDSAKKNYANIKGSHDWGRRWRREQRAWRRQWRTGRWPSSWAWGVPPASYGTRMLSGLMVPILSIAGVLFFWFWAWTIVSLVTRGHVFGEALPDDVPLWVVMLVLVFVFQAIAWPLRFARRRAAYFAFGGPHGGAIGAWDGMVSLAIGILMLWLAYHYVPEVRELVRAVPDVVTSFRWGI